MKRIYDYELFINKLKIIYENQKVYPIHENTNKELHNIVPGNKLTVEEKKHSQSIRKKGQQDTLINKYTNEDNKKKWITEIVQARKINN